MSENSEDSNNKDNLQNMKLGKADSFAQEFHRRDNAKLLNQILKNKSREDIIKDAREYVWSIGLLYRLIKIKVDFICSGFKVVSQDDEVEEKYKELYDKLDINEFIKNFAFEQLVIGESYPFYNWGNDGIKNVSLLNPELTKVKTVLGEDLVYLKPSQDIKSLMNSDNERERQVLNNIVPRDVLNQWEDGKYAVLPEDVADRYAELKAYHEKYAHSPIEPIFPDLKLLSELISADYGVAQKLSQLITHIKVGDENFRDGKQVPPDVIDKVEELFNNPNSSSQTIFSQWFISAEHISPPIEEIFGSEKYQDVVRRIVQWSGLGIFIDTGDAGSSYASGYLKTKPIQQEIDNYRELIKRVLNDFNQLVAEKHGWKTYGDNLKTPNIKFDSNALKEESDVLQVVQFLYQYGLLSEEEVLEEFGYDIARQMDKKEEAQEEYYEKMTLPFEPSQNQSVRAEETDESVNNSEDRLKPDDDNNGDTPRAN